MEHSNHLQARLGKFKTRCLMDAASSLRQLLPYSGGRICRARTCSRLVDGSNGLAVRLRKYQSISAQWNLVTILEVIGVLENRLRPQFQLSL